MPIKFNFQEVEDNILKFWKDNKIHEKANDANKGRKPFYFLDGPPYTSGRVHIGTAWNKSLKDLIMRYKRMQGFDVWDRAGYDMHGMPTEQATEKELGIKNKDEILKMGIGEFTKACQEVSLKNMKYMNEDFRRLGVWMDFDDPYQPITREYIEGEWWLIKKAHENNRLYEGERTMTWCSQCGTALAKHELEYQQVTDDSIFLKFPIVGKENEYLIIWTTTPWTIPFNLGVMVNPKLDYVKAKVDNEIWIVAKGLAGAFISGVADKKFEIAEEFTGDKLKGIKYSHPLENDLKTAFDEIRKKSDKVHTVVLCEEYVDLSAGSGLVHMAPGCGPEDYEIGHREGIQPFNELTEAGIFKDSMGRFAGLQAKKDDKKFIEALDESGLLVASTRVEHDYAHCWRCHQGVVYRTTTQWFFKIEDLKDEMLKINKKTLWVPGFAGSRNFDSWLSNLRDNGITRQRFWGTPLPVWRCEKCKEYEVIGSIKELEEKATNEVPEDLHKPFIDEVKLKCKCGAEMTRIPDILDVWIDAGSASWNCLRYPQTEDDFKRLFPADFILEGIDQIRGWFNLLFVASMVSMKKPSFKAVYMHGFVQDAKGRKMSKSLGNYILPGEVIDKYGADTLRYYMVGGANPGVDINYNFDDVKLKHRNLHILWNLMNYVMDLAKNNGFTPAEPDMKHAGAEEKYILSKSESITKQLTEKLDGFVLNEAPLIGEELFLELSRTYIQLVRDKIATGTLEEKKLAFDVIYKVLFRSISLFSVTCPFTTEQIYQNLREHFKLDAESIFLAGWPKADDKQINSELEQIFEDAKIVIQSILHLREKIQMGQRWPLAKAVIVTDKDEIRKAVDKLGSIIMKQTNIKEISIEKKMPTGFEATEFRTSSVGVDKKLTPDLESEGFAREIMRRVQNQRRKAGLQKNDRIKLSLVVEDKDMEKRLDKWSAEIAKRVGADSVTLVGNLECQVNSIVSEEKIKGRKASICFEKSD